MTTGFRRGMAVLAGVCAASAWAGAVGLISGVLPLGPVVPHRLPWHSPVLAGVALALVVAVPMTVAAVSAWRARPRHADVVTAAGMLLVGWIAVEVALIREFSPLQPACAAVGIVLAVAGARARRTGDGPRRTTAPQPHPPAGRSSIDLYWIPVGAGTVVVRVCGRLWERIAAWHGRRAPRQLFHSALAVVENGTRYTIEMAPVWSERSAERGVVCEGPVAFRVLGRLRAFRYEVRCWRDGTIPDLAVAVGGPLRLSEDQHTVTELLAVVQSVPPLTWGRDELRTGDMWNSNAIVSWLLARVGLPAHRLQPPAGGRAPGWRAGLELALPHEHPTAPRV